MTFKFDSYSHLVLFYKYSIRFEDGILLTKEKVTGGVESKISRKLEGEQMIMEGNVVGKENKFKMVFARQ